MKLLDFYKVYPTEKSCKKEFKIHENKRELYVKSVKHTTYYWKNKRESNGSVKIVRIAQP